MRDLVRESSRSLPEEFEDPSDLLARPAGKNSAVSGGSGPDWALSWVAGSIG